MKEDHYVLAVPWPKTRCIAKSARNVFIEKDGVKKLALDADALYNLELQEWHLLYDISYKFVRYTAILYPNYNDEKRAEDWLFVLYTLNFPLWYPKRDITQWKVGHFIGFYALHQSR